MTNQQIARLLLTIILGGCGMAAAEAAPDVPSERPDSYNDSGVQLSRTRQYLEYQYTQRRLAEEQAASKVERETPQEPSAEETVTFHLNRVDMPASSVLKSEDIEAIAQEYVGKEVSIEDLYALVAKINKLYDAKGYLTCRAYLAPQTIHDGVVRIELIEGKTGEVKLQGNATTKDYYIRDRVSLKEGKVANVNELNRDLLRFNATNDVQLRIAMKAGTAAGTTDYVITAVEPQKEVFGIMADNAGYKTSGLYRSGIYWQDRSLTGNRDSLFLSTLFSQGTKSFAGTYTVPIDHQGSKAGLSYSTNSVHITDGALEPLQVRGHSYAYDLFLTTPVKTTETVKSEIGLDYNYQSSHTSFYGMPWVNDRLHSFQIFYDQIDYGRSTIWYQKHGYRFGRYTNIEDTSRTYGKYELTTLFQKHFRHGQSWNLRVDGQLSSTQYLPSAEMFYLGGMYSVRGYKESLIGGDGGFLASAEYNWPIAKNHQVNVYVFLDSGRVWGRSAFRDRNLVGTGFGIKGNLGNHLYFNTALAFPLIRTINDEGQSRARVHFSLNGTF